MTTDRDLHDPALAAAWREHSREAPPAALDAAILAAAHRAVGSAPRAAEKRGFAPQWRSWWPLAIAATLGAIAFGIVELAPTERDPTTAIVSDSPKSLDAATARAGAAPPSGPAKEAITAAPQPTPPVAQSSPHMTPDAPAASGPLNRSSASSSMKDSSTASTSRGGAPAWGVVVPKPSASDAAPKPDASAVTGNVRDAFAQGQMENKKEVRDEGSSGVREKVAASANLERGSTSRALEPNAAPSPARPYAEKTEQAQAAAKRQEQLQADAEVGGKLTASPEPFPGQRASARKDATGRSAGNEPAERARRSAPIAAATAPATTTNKEREQQARAGSPGLAGSLSSNQVPEHRKSAMQSDRNVNDFIARLREQRAAGRDDDAIRTLRAFRAAYPDAEQMLPADLRAWAATVPR